MLVRTLHFLSAAILLVVILAFSVQAADNHLRITTAKAHGVLKNDRSLYTPDELAAIFRHATHDPPPPDPTNKVADNPRAAILGRLLFFDPRFFKGHRVSCSTCHQPGHAFTDRRAHPIGTASGTRNTPTILNTAYNRWFNWDGSNDSLWSQALYSFEYTESYGNDRMYIVRLVKNDPTLYKVYQRVFGNIPALSDTKRFPQHARPDHDPNVPVAQAWAAMTVPDQTTINRIFSNLGKAIEAYERQLISYRSAFDRYAAGLKAGSRKYQNAISPAAKRGLKLFVGKAKCELCHSGPNFTDGQFHNLGLPLLAGEKEDSGRAGGLRAVIFNPFNGKGRFSDVENRESGDRFSSLPSPESQLGAFKTPSLRNVALTAPYMHDGRFPELWRVLIFYARGKAAIPGPLVGKRDETLNMIPHLTIRQRKDIISFLLTLTSKPLPARLRRAPKSLRR